MNHARKRILISDCDEETLIALERLLEDDGFDTTTASTTSEAIHWLEQRTFDLILAADHPPELNCEALLRSSHVGEIPVVALETVLPRHPFAGPYLLSLGARKVVHKWQHREVQDVVNQLLAKPSPQSAKSAVAGMTKLG